MPDRYLGTEQNSVKIGDPHHYKVGDLVFFSTGNHTVAGEGMFIGRLKADPEVVVLVVGNSFAETPAAACAPLRSGRPAEGRSWRSLYQKRHPGLLASA